MACLVLHTTAINRRQRTFTDDKDSDQEREDEGSENESEVIGRHVTPRPSDARAIIERKSGCQKRDTISKNVLLEIKQPQHEGTCPIVNSNQFCPYMLSTH